MMLYVFGDYTLDTQRYELRGAHGVIPLGRQGQRPVVFITGETGIGKTTLVQAFVAQLSSLTNAWIGLGKCIEYYGAGKAYLPILGAFGHVCRAPHGVRLLALLRHHTPSWCAYLPALVPAMEVEALQQHRHGATPEHRLRELAEAVEVLAAEQQLVLVLEDLHWSDYATLDWLAYVTQTVLGTHWRAKYLDSNTPTFFSGLPSTLTL